MHDLAMMRRGRTGTRVHVIMMVLVPGYRNSTSTNLTEVLIEREPNLESESLSRAFRYTFTYCTILDLHTLGTCTNYQVHTKTTTDDLQVPGCYLPYSTIVEPFFFGYQDTRKVYGPSKVPYVQGWVFFVVLCMEYVDCVAWIVAAKSLKSCRSVKIFYLLLTKS